MNQLRLAKHKFTLVFTENTMLPGFIGNTVRGALGNALDRNGSPAYERVFKAEQGDSFPNPYAVSVAYPSHSPYKRGDKLPFTVTLFGDACDFGGDIVWAAENMCRGKLETCVFDRHELLFDRVWSDAGAENLPPADGVTLKFLTPTEIKAGKQIITEPDFYTFIDCLFGRAGDIIDRYTKGEFILPYSLIARKPFVTAEYNVKPIDFPISVQDVKSVAGRENDKKTHKRIQGFAGDVKYSGDITRYLPYIDLGSVLHVGKKTTHSCGEYSFEI